MTYPIARLSPGETIRLCASVMSALRRDYQTDLTFFPIVTRVSKYQPQPVRRLEVERPDEQGLIRDPHVESAGAMASVVCTGKGGEIYHAVQGDEQTAVFVANEMTYQTEIVRYIASGIAVLTEAAASLDSQPEPEDSEE